MPKKSIRDRLEDFAFEVEWAKRQFDGDDHTRRLYDDMSTVLAAHVPEMIRRCKAHATSQPSYFGHDDDGLRSHRGVDMICLGVIPHDRMKVGAALCQRAAYLGENGKAYIEGPRENKFGIKVIDIHEYGLSDAMAGVRKADLVEMLVPYFI